MEEYIVPNKAIKKMRACRAIGNTTYIYGVTGSGKTELVRQFLKNKPFFYTSCLEHTWDSEELASCCANSAGAKKGLPVVVIDDLHMLYNEEKRKEIIELTGREDIWLILISRSPVPLWLSDSYIRHGFIIISEEDLGLSVSDVTEYLEQSELEISESVVARFVELSEGNGLVVKTSIVEAINNKFIDEEMEDRIRSNYINALEEKVLVWLEPEVKELLMKLSLVDSFNIELATIISGNKNVREVIQRAEESGNFIRKSGDVYTIRSQMRVALYDSLIKAYSKVQIDGFVRNIALYYELGGDEAKAFEYYAKCSDFSKIKEMLVRNSRKSPDTGYYYEMRKYYLMLSNEDIESECCLISSMSLLYSMLMNVEKSEYWYERLKARLDGARGAEKREILSRIAFLDVSLAHRGSMDILDVIKSYYTILTDKSIPFPRFSVTSNLPSTMNGGKDFCEWTRHDKEFAATFGNIIAAFVGASGKGLVNIALAESFYEKGADFYKINSLISKAKNQIESCKVDYNMLFVAEGLYSRLCIIIGEISEARETMEGFFSRTAKTPYIYKLEKNIEAFLCNIALFEGDNKAVAEWMRTKAPDENNFFIMFRYQYITKVLCYIAAQRYAPALALIDRLNDYAQLCDRKYILMQLAILKSIIKYRRNDEWKSEFTEALHTIKEYSFIRVVSEQGSAVYPLLDEVKDEFLSDKDTAEWFRKLLDETHRMLLRYPVYLKSNIVKSPTLSEKAIAILKMQAEGLTLKKIGEKLEITERTAKFHAQETYRKLGAKNRTEAILAAKNLNII